MTSAQHHRVLDAARVAAGEARSALKVAGLAGKLLASDDACTPLTLLAEFGEIDLTVARVVEPYIDALLILAEAGRAAAVGTWGVYAAEVPGTELTATETADGWRLSGVKPWCSLGGLLDWALITASTSTSRQLFEVHLHDPGITVEGARWVARGLTSVTTSDLRFTAVPAVAVGLDDWYFTRPGFAWGGIRVAACWLGATRALVATLAATLSSGAASDPLRMANLGRADVALWTAELAMQHASHEISGGRATGSAAVLLAARVRAVVVDAAEVVMKESGHALGPARLAFDEEHARRIADLTLYIRQHHAERDLAALGGLLTL